MVENKAIGPSVEFETQQALLRETIQLNDDLIAQTDRIIASSRKTDAAPAPQPVQS